jgi:sugar phosphate isomerase/epimerase
MVEFERELALPVGARFGRQPGQGWAWPAPLPDADWAEETAMLRICPAPRVEPWAGSLFGSDGALARLVEDVPNIRLVVDTGHVAQWGGDVTAFLDRADHVQLRQAAPGRGQLPWDKGDVDFAALFVRLTEIGYRGLLTVEYFDLPQFGWPLADPLTPAVQLATHVRPLLAAA